MTAAIRAAEAGIVPDPLLRWGIRRQLRGRLQALASAGPSEDAKARFVEHMRASPIALVPEKANEQHYELPPAFFEGVLGPRMKYSSAYFASETDDLATAEVAMLRLTCELAGIADGMRVLAHVLPRVRGALRLPRRRGVVGSARAPATGGRDMKIAIVGTGISGLVAARRLSGEHEVWVYEAADRIGGHTATVDVEVDGQTYAIDTGSPRPLAPAEEPHARAEPREAHGRRAADPRVGARDQRYTPGETDVEVRGIESPAPHPETRAAERERDRGIEERAEGAAGEPR